MKTLSVLLIVIIFTFSSIYADSSDDIKPRLTSMLGGSNFCYKYQSEDVRYFIGFDSVNNSPAVIVSLSNLKGSKVEIPLLVSVKRHSDGSFLIDRMGIFNDGSINPQEKEGYIKGKDNYLKQFINKNITDEFKVKKDLDAITGASPTSWFIAHTAGVQAKHIAGIYNDSELLKEAFNKKKYLNKLEAY